MPRKKNQKVGRYKQQDQSAPTWDAELCASLVKESPIAALSVKTNAAERATEIHCRLREMRDRNLTVEEEKIFSSLQAQYRKWLEFLKVAEKTNDEVDQL